MNTQNAYQDFAKRAVSVEIFTPEFNTLIREMFPRDNPGEPDRLMESLITGYRDTSHLLESRITTLKRHLSNPEFLIEELSRDGGVKAILVIAYILKAAEILYIRCIRMEASTPL